MGKVRHAVNSLYLITLAFFAIVAYLSISYFGNIFSTKKSLRVKFLEPMANIEKEPDCSYHNKVINPGTYHNLLDNIIKNTRTDQLPTDLMEYNRELNTVDSVNYTDTGLTENCDELMVSIVMKFVMDRIKSSNFLKKNDFTFFDAQLHRYTKANGDKGPKHIKKILANFTLMNVKRSTSHIVTAVIMKTNNKMFLLNLENSMGNPVAWDNSVPTKKEDTGVKWLIGNQIAEQGFNKNGHYDPDGYYIEGGIPEEFK